MDHLEPGGQSGGSHEVPPPADGVPGGDRDSLGLRVADQQAWMGGSVPLRGDLGVAPGRVQHLVRGPLGRRSQGPDGLLGDGGRGHHRARDADLGSAEARLVRKL